MSLQACDSGSGDLDPFWHLRLLQRPWNRKPAPLPCLDRLIPCLPCASFVRTVKPEGRMRGSDAGNALKQKTNLSPHGRMPEVTQSRSR